MHSNKNAYKKSFIFENETLVRPQISENVEITAKRGKPAPRGLRSACTHHK